MCKELNLTSLRYLSVHDIYINRDERVVLTIEVIVSEKKEFLENYVRERVELDRC